MATFAIATGSDDGHETSTGTVAVTSVNTVTSLDNVAEWAGVRFAVSGTGPPQGATINTATLAVYVTDAGTVAGDPDVVIFGEKSVSSATFATTANNISGRTKTTASVAWQSTGLGAGLDQQFSTPSLVTVVQELVNQASWTTSSAITLLIQGGSNAARDLIFRTYEYTGAGGTDPQGTYAAVLTLTWTAAGGTVVGSSSMAMLGVG